ncbi:MAG: ATP-dependent DNA ligase [Candidatus Micrarchaeia archaeon]
MEFLRVARIFDRMESTSSRLRLTAELADLFKSSKSSEIRVLVYICQGVLVPPFKGVDLGIGDKLAQQSISIVSGTQVTEVESLYRKTGDLGVVAQRLFEKKQQRALGFKPLTVEKVYGNFYRVATASGFGSQDLKVKLLAELLSNSRETEAKTIVRFVTGNMRIGIGSPTILDAFSTMKVGDKSLRPTLERAFNLTSDLGGVAEELFKNGIKSLERASPVAFSPVMPALAERLGSSKEIIKKIGRCVVEPKFDGMRLQVHKKNDEVMIFSRRQEPVTRMFPDIVEAVIKQVKAKDAIFEGEAVAFNKKTGKFLPFQKTIQRKRVYGVREKTKEIPLKLFAFDVLYADGKDLTLVPFSSRKKKLKSMLSKNGLIVLFQSIVTGSARKLEDFFKESVNAGLEGVIAKDLNAPYVAGARKFAWIKLKGSYQSGLADSFDLVIVGYYYGKGKRTKFGFGGLLTAAYDDEKNVFKTVAKIGTGFSEEQLKYFSKTLAKITTAKKPLQVVSLLEPDLWVEPVYVVEVRADEITRSPTHTCAMGKNKEGLALRFPRLMSLREDKAPKDATTEKEVSNMFESQ